MDWVETPLAFQDSAQNSVAATLATPARRSDHHPADHPDHHNDRVVILCHGFLSNKESRTNLRLTELLVAHDIATFRFDWFGMGESGGAFRDLTVSTCCDQLEHAITLMHAHGYRTVGLVGSSFGGLIAILTAAGHPELRAVGLKCPVPDFPEMLEREFGLDGIEAWKRTNTLPDVTGGTTPITLDFAFYEQCRARNAYEAARTIGAPVLVVHGQQDELVPIHQIHRLERALPGDSKVVLLPEADHQFGRPEDFRRMTVQLADWMQVHLSPPTRNRS